MNVVWIEDSFDLTESLGDILQTCGYTVMVFPQTPPWETFASLQPHVILLNLATEGDRQSGFAFLEERHSHGLGHVPVIAMTMADSNRDRRQALALGVEHYLVKPIAAHHLLDILRLSLSPLKVPSP